MSNPRVGLALGGGAALGAAHVGVLHALADRGIEPDIVTGTSAGALIGAAFAADLPLELIENQVRAANWTTFGKLTLAPRLALLDSSALSAAIDAVGPQPLIEHLPRRFGAVTTDVRTRSAVVLTSGPLNLALRASIAVPGLFPPISWNGRFLVDGALADNLPIKPARDLGADIVIAVRLRAGWEWPIIGRATAATVAAARDDTEVVIIEPDLRRLSQWSRADVPRLIEAGRRAADVALSRFDLGASPQQEEAGQQAEQRQAVTLERQA